MKLTPKEADAIVRALRYVNDTTYGQPLHDRFDSERHSALRKLEPLARQAREISAGVCTCQIGSGPRGATTTRRQCAVHGGDR
jgi:hypothetical protein